MSDLGERWTDPRLGVLSFRCVASRPPATERAGRRRRRAPVVERRRGSKRDAGGAAQLLLRRAALLVPASPGRSPRVTRTGSRPRATASPHRGGSGIAAASFFATTRSCARPASVDGHASAPKPMVAAALAAGLARRGPAARLITLASLALAAETFQRSGTALGLTPRPARRPRAPRRRPQRHADCAGARGGTLVAPCGRRWRRVDARAARLRRARPSWATSYRGVLPCPRARAAPARAADRDPPAAPRLDGDEFLRALPALRLSLLRFFTPRERRARGWCSGRRHRAAGPRRRRRRWRACGGASWGPRNGALWSCEAGLSERTLTRWRLVLGDHGVAAFGCAWNFAIDDGLLSARCPRHDPPSRFLYDREYGAGRRRSGPAPRAEVGLTRAGLDQRDPRALPERAIERIERDAVERYGIHEIVTNPDVLAGRAKPALLQAVLRTKHLMNRRCSLLARARPGRGRDLVEKLAARSSRSFSGARSPPRRRVIAWPRNFDARATSAATSRTTTQRRGDSSSTRRTSPRACAAHADRGR